VFWDSADRLGGRGLGSRRAPVSAMPVAVREECWNRRRNRYGGRVVADRTDLGPGPEHGPRLEPLHEIAVTRTR
jgi:hypothetical protein